jgi:hypothetical protein
MCYVVIAQSPRPIAARQEGSPKVPTWDLNAAPKNYAGIFAPWIPTGEIVVRWLSRCGYESQQMNQPGR